MLNGDLRWRPLAWMIQFRPIQDAMSLPFLILKIVLVALFLVMFLRTNKAIWGIGLLTVTTAILLDTLLSTFSREEILTELGFFFYIIAGALFAGAAIWFWGLVKDLSIISSRETTSLNTGYIRPVKEKHAGR